MPKAKKILITNVTHEVTVYRKIGPPIAVGYCRVCQRESYFVDLDCAADLTGMGAFHLIRSLSAGLVHAVESSNGHLLICRESVLNNIAN